LKKTKKIPGQFIFKATSGSDMSNRLDPSLQLVLKEDGNTNQKLDSSAIIIREIQEYPSEQIMQPYWSFINNMYIYPESVRLE
jgi:hypothetical protein